MGKLLRNGQAQALTVNNMEVKFSSLYFLKLFITKQQTKSLQGPLLQGIQKQ